MPELAQQIFTVDFVQQEENLAPSKRMFNRTRKHFCSENLQNLSHPKSTYKERFIPDRFTPQISEEFTLRVCFKFISVIFEKFSAQNLYMRSPLTPIFTIHVDSSTSKRVTEFQFRSTQ